MALLYTAEYLLLIFDKFVGKFEGLVVSMVDDVFANLIDQAGCARRRINDVSYQSPIHFVMSRYIVIVDVHELDREIDTPAR